MTIKFTSIVILVAALTAFIFLGCQEETREIFEPEEAPREFQYEEMAPPPPDERPAPPEGVFGPPPE